MQNPQKATYPNLNKIDRPIYQGERGLKLAHRAGSDDLAKAPSRFGNTLHYPDGRKETTK